MNSLWLKSTAPSGLWTSITSSSDGTKLAACINGFSGTTGIYYSSHSGSTWIKSTSAPAASWSSITSSSDGTKLAATATFDSIYYSSDSGSNWTQSLAPGASWIGITSSSDGTNLAACINAFSGTNGIYYSSDSGSTWTKSTSAPAAAWNSIKSSSNGTKFAACIGIQTGTTGIYISMPSLSSSPSIDLSLFTGSNNINFLASSTSYPTFSNFFNGTFNNTTSNGSSVNSYYYLPYDSTYRLLFQWGYIVAAANSTNTTHTYQIPYYNDANNTNPNLNITKFTGTGTNTGSSCIVSSSYTSFVVDTASGNIQKYQIFWSAIGIAV